MSLNVFNSSKNTKEEILEKFNNILLKNNISKSNILKIDVCNFFNSATNSKNVNNLLALKEIGFNLKDISNSVILELIIKSHNKNNFKMYFDIIFDMLDSEQKKKLNEKGNDFCIISFFLLKGKEEVVDYLIEKGLDNKLQERYNILNAYADKLQIDKMIDILENKKYIIEKPYFFLVETFENEKNHNDFNKYINIIINNKNYEKYNSLIFISLFNKVNYTLQDIEEKINIKEIDKDIFKKIVLLNKEVFLDQNPILLKDYPSKINFLQENLLQEDFQEIENKFILYLISKSEIDIIKEIIKQKPSVIQFLKTHNNYIIEKINCLDEKMYCFYKENIGDFSIEDFDKIRSKVSKNLNIILKEKDENYKIKKIISLNHSLYFDCFSMELNRNFLSSLIKNQDKQILKKLLKCENFNLIKNLKKYIENIDLISQSENSEKLNKELNFLVENIPLELIKNSLKELNININKDLLIKISLKQERNILKKEFKRTFNSKKTLKRKRL